MHNGYAGVTTRFLRRDERMMASDASDLPLVIEAKDSSDIHFLQQFLKQYSAQIKADIARYGAVLLRGFDIKCEADFENTVLSIQGMKGISDAFMSEQGRIHVGDLKYVMHTNAVYKTGGTLYLGGFHSENYYSTDVPAYISFCCLEPSVVGGETGLVNAEMIYEKLSPVLREKLEKKSFFVGKWLVSDVAVRYNISTEMVEKLCQYFELPLIGSGKNKFILMYKPNVFMHPVTKQKSLQINYFEVLTLNEEMRQHFLNDYQGNTWFWHRVVWRLPAWVLSVLERVYIMFASLFYSPKESLRILLSKLNVYRSEKNRQVIPPFNAVRVGSCFSKQDIRELAALIRQYYSSCLWQKGDIILVDNLKVLHAGMPGSGPRTIRAMICNPIKMDYRVTASGVLNVEYRNTNTIGYYMAAGKLPQPTLTPEYSE